MKAELLAQDSSTLLESLVVQKGFRQPCAEWEGFPKYSQYETQLWGFFPFFFKAFFFSGPRHSCQAVIHQPNLVLWRQAFSKTDCKAQLIFKGPEEYELSDLCGNRCAPEPYSLTILLDGSSWNCSFWRSDVSKICLVSARLGRGKSCVRIINEFSQHWLA